MARTGANRRQRVLGRRAGPSQDWSSRIITARSSVPVRKWCPVSPNVSQARPMILVPVLYLVSSSRGNRSCFLGMLCNLTKRLPSLSFICNRITYLYIYLYLGIPRISVTVCPRYPGTPIPTLSD